MCPDNNKFIFKPGIVSFNYRKDIPGGRLNLIDDDPCLQAMVFYLLCFELFPLLSSITFKTKDAPFQCSINNQKNVKQKKPVNY
jgi:hypothetical protein